MDDAGYYLRLRGRVTGPFGVAELQAMARRGVLSRIHEMSIDRAQWWFAGDEPELFPRPAGSAPLPSPRPKPRAQLSSPAAPASAPTAPVRKYFYRQDGRTYGPIPLPILQKLAESRKLDPRAQVWPPDEKVMVEARSLPELKFPTVPADEPEDAGEPMSAVAGRRLILAALTALPLLLAALVVLWMHVHSRHLPPNPTAPAAMTQAGKK